METKLDQEISNARQLIGMYKKIGERSDRLREMRLQQRSRPSVSQRDDVIKNVIDSFSSVDLDAIKTHISRNVLEYGKVVQLEGDNCETVVNFCELLEQIKVPNNYQVKSLDELEQQIERGQDLLKKSIMKY